MDTMIGFILGMFIGAVFGLFIGAFLSAAHDDGNNQNNFNNERRQ
jgi:uncharacterized protein YqgC (DUF456 family)